MKMVLSCRRHHYLAGLTIFLVVVALAAGMAGCGGGGGDESYALTVSTTTGGVVAVNDVIIPGTALFTYDAGTVVSLNATPDTGYHFVNWTGNVSTIADVDAALTNITMNGDYSITANFGLEIWDWYDLDAIRDNLDGYYVLVNNLDSNTAGYDELAGPTANGGNGWQPIGADPSSFVGCFDGHGCEVRDLFINRPHAWFVGLFGVVEAGGVIKNVGVVNTTVSGNNSIGGLVGHTKYCTVSNSYSTGSVTGYACVGGLVGYNYEGTVSNSYSASSVTGDDSVGGLVGCNFGTVHNSYSTGGVSGNLLTGGLVGDNNGQSTVSNSCSTGNVSGDWDVGGLVGVNSPTCTISSSYSTGSVSGNFWVGGLAAYNLGTVSNSYSTGSVTGDQYVGGLVGDNGSGGSVSNSYSTGSVSGIYDVGGLLGRNSGAVSDSFWDTETSGEATSDGGTGKTTGEMQDISTFSGAGWDIVAVANPGTRNTSYIWNTVDDETYPFLSWQPLP